MGAAAWGWDLRGIRAREIRPVEPQIEPPIEPPIEPLCDGNDCSRLSGVAVQAGPPPLASAVISRQGHP